MAEGKKYHAIKVDIEKCFGCTHCVKACPTEAIRIKNGKAVIDDKRCVDCGNCKRVCPVDAFYIEQDDISQIENYKYRVALFPSVMIGQFPETISESQVYDGILKLGFTHVFEVEQPIQLLIDSIREYSEDHANEKPLISSFCPAIVRLVQMRYPALVDKVLPIKAPHDLAAHFAIEKLKEDGASVDEIGIFYITPCSAKMAAVKRPLGEKESIVNGIINMSEFFDKVMKAISPEPVHDSSGLRQNLSREGVMWSLTGGESETFHKRALAIDGIKNVVKILERLENEKLPDVSFLELRSCNQSCAGGILLSGNRFLTVERLKRRAKRYPNASEVLPAGNDFSALKEKIKAEKIEPEYIFQLDSDRAKALTKMDKVQRIICQLPGIDCGACGAPNCQALAEDIVQGKAKMSDCVFLQERWQKEGKISAKKAFSSLEKTWGKGRFEADCNKKGARNEGY